MLHYMGSAHLQYCFFWFGTDAWVYALTDALVHYHIDWAKMNISKRFDIRPDNSEWFWILLGFDQLLHHLTYFAIVAMAFKSIVIT